MLRDRPHRATKQSPMQYNPPIRRAKGTPFRRRGGGGAGASPQTPAIGPDGGSTAAAPPPPPAAGRGAGSSAPTPQPAAQDHRQHAAQAQPEAQPEAHPSKGQLGGRKRGLAAGDDGRPAQRPATQPRAEPEPAEDEDEDEEDLVLSDSDSDDEPLRLPAKKKQRKQQAGRGPGAPPAGAAAGERPLAPGPGAAALLVPGQQPPGSPVQIAEECLKAHMYQQQQSRALRLATESAAMCNQATQRAESHHKALESSGAPADQVAASAKALAGARMLSNTATKEMEQQAQLLQQAQTQLFLYSSLVKQDKNVRAAAEQIFVREEKNAKSRRRKREARFGAAGEGDGQGEKIGAGRLADVAPFRRLGATSVHMAAGSGASAINPRSSWLKHTCEGRVLYQDTAGRPGKCGYEVFSRHPPPEGVRAEGEVQRSKNFDESYVEASKNDAGILSPKSTWVKVTLAGDARIFYQDQVGGAGAEESPASLRFPAAGIAREVELPRGQAEEFETLWKAAREADASTASQWVKYISTGGATTEKSYYHHSQTRAWSLEPPAEGAPTAVRRRFNTMENEFVLGRLAPGSVLGLNPVSDWGMIKCGDRAFYHNFETGVSSLKVPGEGWCETQEKPESVFERHYPPPPRGAPFVHTPDPLSTLAEELVPEGDDRMLWFSMDEALRREMHALGPCERPEEVARWAKQLSAGDVCDVNLTHATHPRTDTALFQIGNDTAAVDTYLKRIGIASWIIHLRRHLPSKMGTVAEIRSVTADEIRQVAKDGKQDQVTESTISKVLKALEKEPRSLVWAAFTLDDRTLYQITGSRPLVNSRLEPKEGVRNTNVVPEKDKDAFGTNWEKAGRYDAASTPESRQRDVDSAVRQPLPKDKNIPRWVPGTVMSATSTHLTVSIDIASLKPALPRCGRIAQPTACSLSAVVVTRLFGAVMD